MRFIFFLFPIFLQAQCLIPTDSYRLVCADEVRYADSIASGSRLYISSRNAFVTSPRSIFNLVNGYGQYFIQITNSANSQKVAINRAWVNRIDSTGAGKALIYIRDINVTFTTVESYSSVKDSAIACFQRAVASGLATLSDGDYGDVVVSGGGLVMTVDKPDLGLHNLADGDFSVVADSTALSLTNTRQITLQTKNINNWISRYLQNNNSLTLRTNSATKTSRIFVDSTGAQFQFVNGSNNASLKIGDSVAVRFNTSGSVGQVLTVTSVDGDGRLVINPKTGGSGTANCEQTLTKTAHGFRKWTPIYWNGSTWVRPTYDSIIPTYIVVDSTSANTFKVANCGNYSTSLTSGVYYYTGTSPGYTLAQPEIKVPLFEVAQSRLILQPLIGFQLAGGTGDVTSSVLADTAAAIRADFPSGVSDGDKGDITVSGGTWAINNNAVTTGKILDGTILNADLANQTLDSNKIKNRTITTVKLADDAVTSAKIGTGQVGADELASSGVTAGTYGSGSVVPVVTVDQDGRITGMSTASVSGGGSNINYYNTFAQANSASVGLSDGAIVEVLRDTTTAGATRTRYTVSGGTLTAKTVLTNYVTQGQTPYIQSTDTTTVPDVFVAPNGSAANNGRLKSTPKQTIPTGVAESANTTNKLTYIQKGTYTNGTFTTGSGNKIFGQRDTFPLVYEGVRVKNWLATSNANTYKKSIAHTIGNFPNYNHIEVYEIDTALYRISPVLGRKMLKYYRTYDTTSVFANRGSYTFKDLISPTWVYIRPTSGNINSNKYRYELILSETRITMGGQSKNEVKNIHFLGTGNGYGNIDGGFDLKVDGVIFEGGNTHSTVQASGIIKNSLFYDHFVSANDNLASVFYTSTGSGLKGQFYNNTFIDIRDCVYNHTEGATRYVEVISDNNSLFGGRSKKAKTGLSSSNTQRMIARNNYVEYYDYLINTQTDTAYWYGNCLVNGQLAQTPFFQPIIYATKNVIYNGNMAFSAKQFETNVVVNTVNTVQPGVLANTRIVGNIFINRDTQQINAMSVANLTGIDSISRNVYILANRDATFRWVSTASPALNTTDINVVKTAGYEQGSLVIDLTSNPDDLYTIFKDPDNGDFTLIPNSKYYAQILNAIQVDGIIARRQAKPTIEQAMADMREVGYVRKIYSARKSPTTLNTVGGSKFSSNATSTHIGLAAQSATYKNITWGYSTNTNGTLLPTGSKSILVHVGANAIGSGFTRMDSSIFIGINKVARAGSTLKRSIYIGLNPPGNIDDFMSIGDEYGIQRYLQGSANYGQAWLFPDAPNKIFLGWVTTNHTSNSNIAAGTMILGNRQITEWQLGSNSDSGPATSQLVAPSKRIETANQGYTPATQYFRILGPRSVGAANGGSFRLAVTPAGASGSTLNAAFDAITIYGADGNVGISNVTSPTAKLHIAAGTATASTAPMKFNSGTLLTTAEAGAVEYDGTEFYATNSTASRTVLARVLKGSATLDFPDTASGSSSSLTITVTGAATTDSGVSIQRDNANIAGTFYEADITGANTVTIFFHNFSGSNQNPASGTFRVVVTK